jgi:hypothetical protein
MAQTDPTATGQSGTVPQQPKVYRQFRVGRLLAFAVLATAVCIAAYLWIL